MSNILLEYMKKRFKSEPGGITATKTKIGPVVTISREYGCPAKRLAGMLTSALNRIELENYNSSTHHIYAHHQDRNTTRNYYPIENHQL